MNIYVRTNHKATFDRWVAVYRDVFACKATCEACKHRFLCWTDKILTLDFEDAVSLYMKGRPRMKRSWARRAVSKRLKHQVDDSGGMWPQIHLNEMSEAIRAASLSMSQIQTRMENLGLVLSELKQDIDEIIE